MAYGRSNFPTEYDVFKELLDLPPSKSQDADRYMYLKQKENKTQAELDELNNLSTLLEDYIISPERWNYMGDALTGTQKFFNENTQVYVDNLQADTKAYVDTKKTEMTDHVNLKKNEVTTYVDDKKIEFDAEIDKFNYKGSYSSTTTYNEKNVVSYQGQSYLCLSDNTLNILPTDTNYWALIAKRGVKGDKGADGGNLTFKGEYDATYTYVKDDLVSFEGHTFACIQETTGNNPSNDIYWNIFIEKSGVTDIYKNSTTLSQSSPSVEHGFTSFNKQFDKLLVYKNSVYIEEGIDYEISSDGFSINSLNGDWNSGTEFNFIAFYPVVSDDTTTVSRLPNLVEITEDNTTNISIGITEFDADRDVLEVYQDNLQLYEGNQWVLNSNKTSIDLVSYSLNTGDQLMFYVWKEVRNKVEVDGQYLNNNSVTNDKFATDIKVGSLANLNSTISDKTSVTNAVNNVDNKFENFKNDQEIMFWMGV